MCFGDFSTNDWNDTAFMSQCHPDAVPAHCTAMTAQHKSKFGLQDLHVSIGICPSCNKVLEQIHVVVPHEPKVNARPASL